MDSTEPPIYTASSLSADDPLRQGEIISKLTQVHLDVTNISGDLSVLAKTHPLALIISQDCDLEQDFKARRGQATRDKMVPNVLFCEVSTAEKVRHIGDEIINSKIWANIRTNSHPRYQFLQEIKADSDRLNEGFEELCLDFKYFFSIPTDEVYERIRIGEARRRCRLVSPYLEHLASRFASFLSRVGLPRDHASA